MDPRLAPVAVLAGIVVVLYVQRSLKRNAFSQATYPAALPTPARQFQNLSKDLSILPTTTNSPMMMPDAALPNSALSSTLAPQTTFAPINQDSGQTAEDPMSWSESRIAWHMNQTRRPTDDPGNWIQPADHRDLRGIEPRRLHRRNDTEDWS